MQIKEPIIGEKALFYYKSALSPNKFLYEKAFNLRLCLEKLIDSIAYPILFGDSDKEKYYMKKDGKIKIYDKGKPMKVELKKRIDILGNYFDSDFMRKLTAIRLLGNNCVHDGMDYDISKEEVDELFEIISEFPIKLFSILLEKNGFYNSNSWTLTVLSVLPPYYRIRILNEYFLKDKSPIVIEKLSMAYLKNNEEDKAFNLIKTSLNNKYITIDQYGCLIEKISLLRPHLKEFRIAKNLDDSKELLKELLQAIDLEERNFCVDLISIICDIDIFNNEKIIKNNNDYFSFRVAIKFHGKDCKCRANENNIVISRNMANKLNINKFDILSDKLNNIYKIAYIEEDYSMPYDEENGDAVDICINPYFVNDNKDKFKEIILNENSKAKECYLIDGGSGRKYQEKILVFNLQMRRNS